MVNLTDAYGVRATRSGSNGGDCVEVADNAGIVAGARQQRPARPGHHLFPDRRQELRALDPHLPLRGRWVFRGLLLYYRAEPRSLAASSCSVGIRGITRS